MSRVLEVCAADIESVHAAARGGAARVEICSGLAEGGFTPSAGFMHQARQVPGLRVHALIRPRSGDFAYTPEEIDLMVNDIARARECGLDGVAIGALTPEGDLDVDACRRMLDVARGMSATLHRAFDLCRDPFATLEQAIDLGFDRILTSGCAPSAMQGVDMLRRLNQQARGRIVIMAAAGVIPANAGAIVAASGVNEIHASARSPHPSAMTYRHPGVSMGAPGSDEYSRMTTDPAIVHSIVTAINQ